MNRFTHAHSFLVVSLDFLVFPLVAELRVQKGKAPRSEFKVGTGETVSVRVNTSEEAVLVSSVYKALGGIFPTENQLHSTHDTATESSR